MEVESVMISRYAHLNVRLAILVLILFCSASANAAFCSLRDPASAIQHFYPAASDFRSIVKTVRNSSREQLTKGLPIDFHFNEFGRHTVYVVFRDTLPIGLIHSRSEATPWGLVELAWSLDTNYRVRDFIFQRCRSRLCNDELREEILRDIRGQDLSALAAMLSHSKPRDGLASKREEFKLTILKSALKTAALTELEWGEEVEALVLSGFSGFFETDSRVSNVERMESKAIGIEAVQEIQSLDYLDPNSLQLFKVRRENGEVLSLTQIDWHFMDREGRVLLAFDEIGRPFQFHQVFGQLGDENASAFMATKGNKVKSLDACANLSELTVRALYLASNADG
jgi:hypothetical protein